jgi:uncharacterized protein YbaR (Trm112 family)
VIPVKPWLLEILACPIDKHYPLNLSIFKIEDGGDEFAKKARNIEAMTKDLSFFFKNALEDEEYEAAFDVPVITNDEESGAVLVFDALVRKPASPVQYLELILASIDELKPIQDLEGSAKSIIEELLEFRNEVTSVLDAMKENVDSPETQKQKIMEIKDKLILLNWFKQAVEIEAGVMTCTECNRWYPIRETIPQMLPDELRKKKYDNEFLETWKSLLDDSILKEGNPFHLD